MALSRVSRIVFWALLVGGLGLGFYFFYRYLTQDPHSFHPDFRDAVASGVFRLDGSLPGLSLSCIPPSATDIRVQWKPKTGECWAAYRFPSSEEDALLAKFAGRAAKNPSLPRPVYSSSWWLSDGARDAAGRSGSVFLTESGEVLVLPVEGSRAFYYRPRGNPDRADVREVSCNFDLKNLQPFLERLPPLFESGFTAEAAARIAEEVRRLRVDAEKSYEFPVRFLGAAAVMKIRVVMDDVESPDLYIHAAPNLADRIEAELKKFLEEKGL